MCGFFKWFNPANFLDTFKEWHALIEGMADGFCRSAAHYKPYDAGSEDDNLLTAIRKEHHYYNCGRAIGFALLIVLLTGMAIWFTYHLITMLAWLKVCL